MKPLITSLLTASALVGCASTTTPKYANIISPFNPNEVAWIKKEGVGTVTGQAFLKTRGGDVKTCAGNKVILIPSSNYAVERIRLLYGTGDKGISYNLQTSSGEYLPVSDPLYQEYTLQTYCDASGNFEFDNLPDGIYYINTSVFWETGAKYKGTQGGYLMQRVAINGGSSNKYIIAY